MAGCASKFDTAGEFVGATLVVVPAWQPRGLPLRRRQFASGKVLQDRHWNRCNNSQAALRRL